MDSSVEATNNINNLRAEYREKLNAQRDAHEGEVDHLKRTNKQNTAKKSKVFQENSSKMESNHKQNLQTVSRNAIEVVENAKNKFKDKNLNEKKKFSQLSATRQKNFDDRMTNLSESFRKNSQRAEEQHQDGQITARKRFNRTISERERQHENDLNNFVRNTHEDSDKTRAKYLSDKEKLVTSSRDNLADNTEVWSKKNLDQAKAFRSGIENMRELRAGDNESRRKVIENKKQERKKNYPGKTLEAHIQASNKGSRKFLEQKQRAYSSALDREQMNNHRNNSKILEAHNEKRGRIRSMFEQNLDNTNSMYRQLNEKNTLDFNRIMQERQGLHEKELENYIDSAQSSANEYAKSAKETRKKETTQHNLSMNEMRNEETQKRLDLSKRMMDSTDSLRASAKLNHENQQEHFHRKIDQLGKNNTANILNMKKAQMENDQDRELKLKKQEQIQGRNLSMKGKEDNTVRNRQINFLNRKLAAAREQINGFDGEGNQQLKHQKEASQGRLSRMQRAYGEKIHNIEMDKQKINFQAKETLRENKLVNAEKLSQSSREHAKDIEETNFRGKQRNLQVENTLRKNFKQQRDFYEKTLKKEKVIAGTKLENERRNFTDALDRMVDTNNKNYEKMQKELMSEKQQAIKANNEQRYQDISKIKESFQKKLIEQQNYYQSKVDEQFKEIKEMKERFQEKTAVLQKDKTENHRAMQNMMRWKTVESNKSLQKSLQYQNQKNKLEFQKIRRMAGKRINDLQQSAKRRIKIMIKEFETEKKISSNEQRALLRQNELQRIDELEKMKHNFELTIANMRNQYEDRIDKLLTDKNANNSELS